MLEALITSKTRLKLLLKFFLNVDNKAYLRALEKEFKDSANGIRAELERFEEADLLLVENQGNRKFYTANTKHPLFTELHHLVMKHLGIHQIIEQIAMRIGNLQSVYLVGELAKGLQSDLIDLYFFGNQIDQHYLMNLVGKTEKLINCRIRFMIFSLKDQKQMLTEDFIKQNLLLWQKD